MVESELRLDLYKYKDMQPPFTIFVGSTIDMFADAIPSNWISRTLEHCRRYPDNNYLFQSKNPKRFTEFYSYFPKNTILGTTLESNREYPEIYRNAPCINDRYSAMKRISKEQVVMVTIEPILDFDLNPFIEMLYDIGPSWVNIGADSKGHNLPEPAPEKIKELIESLQGFTQVKIKKNLERIIKGGHP